MRQTEIKDLYSMLKENARVRPEKAALYFADKNMSYSRLCSMAESFGQGLRNLGVSGGGRVAVLLPNCPEFVIAYFGIMKALGVCVPVNNMFKEDEIGFILEDSQANTIVTSMAYLDTARSIKAKSRALKSIVLTDGVVPDAINLYEMIERSEPVRQIPLPLPDDPASILYTSGTTGSPKGAVLTHGNFLSNVRSCLEEIKANDRDNFICVLPMFHSFAFTVCIVLPFFAGAAVTIIEHIRPFRRVVRNVIKKKVTVFVGIPSIFNVLAHMHIPAVFTSRVLKMIDPLRVCISGAAALPSEVLLAFEDKFRVPLLEGYGLTEAAPVVSLNPMHSKRKPGSVGLEIKGVSVRIINASGEQALPGEPGELLVKGPNVMKGYLNNPDADREVLKDGWLYTGDIAKRDSEGYLYIVDRKKDMINVRGLNVYPAEVEKVLLRHPKIKEAAVVKAFDKFKGEVPRAFIVLKDGVELSRAEAVKYLRDNLALFKVPRSIEFRQSLARTATGKIKKTELS